MDTNWKKNHKTAFLREKGLLTLKPILKLSSSSHWTVSIQVNIHAGMYKNIFKCIVSIYLYRFRCAFVMYLYRFKPKNNDLKKVFIAIEKYSVLLEIS